MQRDFDEALHLSAALASLDALLPNGLESLPPRVFHAVERDDYSDALAAANQYYAEHGPGDRVGALTYAILLTGRELVGEAFGVLRKALEQHEQDLALQLAQAETLVARGSEESARQLMDGLRNIDIQDARYWGFLGDLYLDMGHDDDVVVCYEKAIEKGSQDGELVLRLAHLYVERNDLERAAQYFERAGRLAPESASIWEMAADVRLELGDIEQAIYAYERVLKQEPENEHVLLYLGVAYGEAGELGKAIKTLRKLTRIAPMDAEPWIYLGNAQFEAADPGAALESYRKAREVAADNVDAINGMVAAAFELGDVELARETAQQAVEHNPDNAESQYNLGFVLDALHRHKEALIPLQRAIELEPGEARYLAALALAKLRLRRQDEAFDTIGEALDKELEDPEPLLEFAEELLKQGASDEALQFEQRTHVDRDPAWEVMVALLTAVGHAMQPPAEAWDQAVTAFAKTVRERPEAIPVVLWDFDELRRITATLSAERKQVVDTMINVLEGHDPVEKLPA